MILDRFKNVTIKMVKQPFEIFYDLKPNSDCSSIQLGENTKDINEVNMIFIVQ